MKRMILLLSTALLAFLLSLPFSAAEPLKALRAVRISPTEIVVEFNKAVDENGIKRPFVALRRMKMEGGIPTGLAWDGAEPLQASSTSTSFYGNDHSRILIAFDEYSLDLYLRTTGNPYYDRGYRTYLGMEERQPPSGHSHENLFDVRAEDGSLLQSTLHGKNDEWDGVYLNIEVNYDYEKKDYADVTRPAPENPTETTDAPDSESVTQAPSGNSGCGSSLAPLPLFVLPLLTAALHTKRSKH